jgi:DNA-binding transcriptional LysR family regulator
VDVSAHSLRYFVAVSEERHFGRAAARLHLTTSSLSEQVSRLEKRLGTPLLERTPRGVELTDAGRELLPLARSAVAANEAIGAWADERATARGGMVRVGVVAAVAAELRADVAAAAALRHPDLHVVTRRQRELLPAVRAAQLDVAFSPGLPTDMPWLRSVEVAREGRVLVAPSGHPLAGRDAVSIGETRDEVFIPMATATPAGDAWWLVDPRPDGSHPRRGPAAGDIDDMLDLCAAGRGLGMAAASDAQHYTRPGITFVPLTDVEDIPVALCWRADERDPAVLAYVGLVRRTADGGEPPAPSTGGSPS